MKTSVEGHGLPVFKPMTPPNSDASKPRDCAIGPSPKVYQLIHRYLQVLFVCHFRCQCIVEEKVLVLCFGRETGNQAIPFQTLELNGAVQKQKV